MDNQLKPTINLATCMHGRETMGSEQYTGNKYVCTDERQILNICEKLLECQLRPYLPYIDILNHFVIVMIPGLNICMEYGLFKAGRSHDSTLVFCIVLNFFKRCYYRIRGPGSEHTMPEEHL